MPIRHIPFACLLAAASLLAACGGGSESGPAVSNLSASTPGYGKLLTLTVTGSGLDSSVTAAIEPGCFTMTRSSQSTEASATYTCVPAAVGDLRVRVRNADGKELATLRLDVPIPRVSMEVTQGSAKGSMVIELDPVAAPKTVTNFLTYVNASGCYYKDTLFHRVDPSLRIVQGGGYIAGLTRKTARSPIELESNNGLKNLRGTIAMARTNEPNSATSEFYFNTQDNDYFDYKSPEQPGYAVFGRVLEDVAQGLAVIDYIQAVETESKTVDLSGGQQQVFPNAPKENVRITACSQIR